MKKEPKIHHFCLGDLPLQIFTDAQAFMLAHSTVLVFEDDIAGSGTYVKCGDTLGILTAHHVAFQRSPKFNFGPGSTQCLGLGVAGFPHRFEFDMHSLIPHEIGVPSNEEFGPDLLFIEIPRTDPKLDTILAKRQMWDIGNNSKERITECYDDVNCVWVTAGHPSELKTSQNPSHGFDEVMVFPGLFGITGVEHIHERGDYDYFDTYADFSSGNDIPRSFAGESGGTLWKVPVNMKNAGDSLDKLEIGTPVLAGVIFYQGPVTDNRRLVRSHGPKSIYNVLRDKLS